MEGGSHKKPYKSQKTISSHFIRRIIGMALYQTWTTCQKWNPLQFVLAGSLHHISAPERLYTCMATVLFWKAWCRAPVGTHDQMLMCCQTITGLVVTGRPPW